MDGGQIAGLVIGILILIGIVTFVTYYVTRTSNTPTPGPTDGPGPEPIELKVIATLNVPIDGTTTNTGLFATPLSTNPVYVGQSTTAYYYQAVLFNTITKDFELNGDIYAHPSPDIVPNSYSASFGGNDEFISNNGSEPQSGEPDISIVHKLNTIADALQGQQFNQGFVTNCAHALKDYYIMSTQNNIIHIFNLTDFTVAGSLTLEWNVHALDGDGNNIYVRYADEVHKLTFTHVGNSVTLDTDLLLSKDLEFPNGPVDMRLCTIDSSVFTYSGTNLIECGVDKSGPFSTTHPTSAEDILGVKGGLVYPVFLTNTDVTILNTLNGHEYAMELPEDTMLNVDSIYIYGDWTTKPRKQVTWFTAIPNQKGKIYLYEQDIPQTFF